MKVFLMTVTVLIGFNFAQAQTNFVESNFALTTEQTSDEFTADRIVTADQMLCADVVDQYERTGRIYVIANGKDVVPLYGYLKLSKEPTTQCRGKEENYIYMRARSLDKRFCIFAFYCGAA